MNISQVILFLSLAAAISTKTVPFNENYWEKSGKYQGDILLHENSPNRNGNPSWLFGLINAYRWPFRTLIYDFDTTISEEQKAIIETSLQHFPMFTNVKVRRRYWFDRNYVKVTNKVGGCYAHVGYVGGAQTLNLQHPDCTNKATILHEFTHALGFWHMQNDASRDAFVKVKFDNIPENVHYAFDRMPYLSLYGVSYDKQSIMHYSNYAFAIDKTKPTIVSREYEEEVLGGSELTSRDIERINQMYYYWF